MFTELTKNYATFGRASLGNEVEGFKFTELPKISVACVSKKHFVISRDETSDDEENMNPPIVKCYSSNGMFVNQDELEENQQRILLDGDKIMICNVVFFKFKDLRFTRVQARDVFPSSIRNKYFFGELLGKGSYGKVHKIHDIKSLEKFAMKSVSLKREKNGMPCQYQKTQIEQEINIMKELKHPNLMTLIGNFERSRHIFLIMNLMDMDLLHYLTKDSGNFVLEGDAKFMFFQICKGVEHLHSKNIAHRDLKVDNVLVKLHNVSSTVPPIVQLSIGDFGFSKYASDGEFYTQLGTTRYMAPEIVVHKAYTTKADVWSLGCMLFTILTKRFPFDKTYGDLREQILTASYHKTCLNKVTGNSRV